MQYSGRIILVHGITAGDRNLKPFAQRVENYVRAHVRKPPNWDFAVVPYEWEHVTDKLMPTHTRIGDLIADLLNGTARPIRWRLLSLILNLTDMHDWVGIIAHSWGTVISLVTRQQAGEQSNVPCLLVGTPIWMDSAVRKQASNDWVISGLLDPVCLFGIPPMGKKQVRVWSRHPLEGRLCYWPRIGPIIVNWIQQQIS